MNSDRPASDDRGGGSPAPAAVPPGGAALAPRVWLVTVLLLLLAALVGLILAKSWYDSTREHVVADVHDRLTGALLETALPTDHMLDGFERLLGAMAEADQAAFEVLLAARSGLFLSDRASGYQITRLTKSGAVRPGQDGSRLPPGELLMQLLERARAGDGVLLGPAYRHAGQWHASVVAPGPRGAAEERGFVALSFPLTSMTERWRASGLPEGSSLSLLRADGRLWWRYPLEESALESDRSLGPTVAATRRALDDAPLTPVAPRDSSSADTIVGGRRLNAFGLRFIATMPAEQISRLWQARHGASLVLFLATELLLAGAILFAGWTLSREARRRERASADLEDSRRRLRDIADASSDWFWETGPDNRLTSISSRFEDLVGVPVSAFIGKRREEVLSQGLIDKDEQQRYQAAVATRRPFRDFVYPFRFEDGRLCWFQLSGKPVFDADGRFCGYRGVGTDITRARKTEHKVSALQARLARAIEYAPEAFALFDDKGCLAILNAGFAELFQAPGQELIKAGDRYGDLMIAYARSGLNPAAKRDPAAWIKSRARLHETGESIDERLADGRWIRTREQWTPESELICTYTDITTDKRREAELIQLNEENRRLVAAVDAADVGIVIANPALEDCPMIFVNPAFCRITGYRAEEALGRNCRLLQGPETDPAATRRMRSAIEAGRSVEVEMVNYRKDGSTFWNLASISPVFDDAGGLRYFVGTQTDITQQKRAGQQLVDMKEEAESASRSKSEFLAIMSHELRTPLNAIIGFSDILKAEMFGPVGDARYRDYACDIYESGSHLLSMINEILDFSKAEAGKLELREDRFDLRETIESTLSMVRPRADSAGIVLALEAQGDCPAIFGDERKIKQVLLNLLANAIKFSTEGDKVSVSVMRLDEGVEVAVIDRGVGIAEADIAKALEPFGQIDGAHDREHEGTGLGLPLAKRLVELHGGTLTIESRPGFGTRVSFRVPESRIHRDAA